MMKRGTLARFIFSMMLMASVAWLAAGVHAADLAADALVVPPGKTYRTVLVSTTQSVKADLTVPANVVLKFDDGGMLEVAEGVTLTINGPVEAPLIQVFRGSGKVAFGPGRIKAVYPQWWGATGDGKTDDTSAIQSAIDSVAKGTVSFPAGSYANTGVTVKSFLRLQGDGMEASKLLFTPASGSCITLPEGCGGFRFEDMSLKASGGGAGYGIHGAKGWVRYFSMYNFSVTGFKRGVYIERGGHISISRGYISCYGMGAANGTVGLQLGDRSLDKACTSTTVEDVYFTNAETCFYNRAAPCAIIRPIFETCQIGLDIYTRATVMEPFFAGCKKAAARMTDNGVFFIGPSPREYTFLYAGSAEKARTSFFPDTFDSPMKLGPMYVTPDGRITIGGKALSHGSKAAPVAGREKEEAPAAARENKEAPVAAKAAEKGLVGYWSFDGNLPEDVKDLSGQGNDGRCIGQAQLVKGGKGHALELTGTGCVTVADSDSLDLTDKGTVAAWVLVRSYDAKPLAPAIVQKGKGGGWTGGSYFIYYNNPNDTIYGAIYDGKTNDYVSLGKPPVGQWHHLAFTWDGSTVRGYLNGELVKTAPQTVKAAPNKHALWIGRSLYGSMKCLMDEVMVFNHALTDKEVTGIYGEGKAAFMNQEKRR